MEKVKRFFRIEKNYKFEMNDLRAVVQIINVVLIMIFGLSFSWLGLAIATGGLIKDLLHDRRVNGILMHLAGMVLNIYFLKVLYFG